MTETTKQVEDKVEALDQDLKAYDRPYLKTKMKEV